nr:probable ATP-dependent RNA helicase DDX5 [Dermacentor andersoni]
MDVLNMVAEAFAALDEIIVGPVGPPLQLQPPVVAVPANANGQRNEIAPPYKQAHGDSQQSATEMRKKGIRSEGVNKTQACRIPPRWDYVRVETVEKNIYREHVTSAQRSEIEVNAYRLDNGIEIGGRAVPKPILNIEEANLPGCLYEWLRATNHGSLTSIEAQCWPVALSGRDLLAVVQAAPLEVKAVAYLVPAVVHVLSQRPLQSGDGPIALVVVATREMAREVYQVACSIQECTKVRSACLSCREPKEPQLEDLEKRPQICIATPGRLLSFLKEGRVHLLRCTHVVFDRADLMMDLGIEFQIQAIREWIRPDHQTQVWLPSRTQNVRPLCEDLLEDYVQVSIDVKPALPHDSVEQIVFVCDEADKGERLVELLQDIDDEARDKVIIFAETKQTVDDIVGLLALREHPAIGIHGKKTDEELDWALSSFRENGTSVLVSTDLFSRKLDVPGGARFVVNYDYPRCSDVYMMRLRRAAWNSGRAAVAYTLFTHQDKRHASDLVSILRDARQPVPVELKDMLKETGRERRLGRGKQCAS